jgi:RNA polymerase sigma factor (sigma-70 family)
VRRRARLEAAAPVLQREHGITVVSAVVHTAAVDHGMFASRTRTTDGFGVWIVSTDALATATRMGSLRRTPPPSDDVLRTMAAGGDAVAFGAAYERHQQALYRYCRSIVGHEEDAHDALQAAMVKAWAALQRRDPGVPLRPWLFRIAHNEAVNVLRGRRRHHELDETHAVAGASVHETLEMRQRLATLQADLAALPERQRSALLLRELSGLRHDEIAVVLAISPAMVRQTVYEARLALHEAEAGREMTCAAIQRALSDGDGRARRGRRIRSHLRACHTCSSFDTALHQRSRQLAALYPPMPAAAASALVARLVSHAGASGSASSGAIGTTAP